MTGSFDLQDVLFYGGLGFSIFRGMSFALENCEKKDGNYSLGDMLKYNFYLPFFFFGPIMTFDQFHAQVSFRGLCRVKPDLLSLHPHTVSLHTV